MTDGHFPKVTVYVPSHNYGRWLDQSLSSVREQSMTDWELLIFNDASDDETAAVAERFLSADGSQRVSLISFDERRGLRGCANEAIRRARGDYVMRLDADDYLDPNALLVLSHVLDTRPEVALVFPNWHYVSEAGEYLGTEHRQPVAEHGDSADLPPHGACTMVRRRVLRQVGGYDESFESQDGHELWMRVTARFRAASVAAPLFNYRQHPSSLSKDQDRLLENRRRIKQTIGRESQGRLKPVTSAVVVARNDNLGAKGPALETVAGTPLILHTVDSALRASRVDHVIVSTDDERVIGIVGQHAPSVLCHLRDPALSLDTVKLSAVFADGVAALERHLGLAVDIAVLLSINSPLRTSDHIDEAIDTLDLYPVDQVVSCFETSDLTFRHNSAGLEPLNPGAIDKLRFEREALLSDNGAIRAMWRDVIDPASLFVGKIGHIVMSREDSLQIKHPWERVFIEEELARRRDSGDS